MGRTRSYLSRRERTRWDRDDFNQKSNSAMEVTRGAQCQTGGEKNREGRQAKRLKKKRGNFKNKLLPEVEGTGEPEKRVSLEGRG